MSKKVNFVNDYKKDHEYDKNIFFKNKENIKNLLTTFKRHSCSKICEILKL